MDTTHSLHLQITMDYKFLIDIVKNLRNVHIFFERNVVIMSLHEMWNARSMWRIFKASYKNVPLSNQTFSP